MVIFRITIVIFLYSFFLYPKSIMIVPLGVDYNNTREEEIGLLLFDTVNSAILDTNVFFKRNNRDSNMFVKEGLLPNKKYQKNISKFYEKINNKKIKNIDYLEKISTDKKIDILVFLNIHNKKKIKKKLKKKKTQKKDINVSISIYNVKDNNISQYFEVIHFDKDGDLSDNSINIIKRNFTSSIIE